MRRRHFTNFALNWKRPIRNALQNSCTNKDFKFFANLAIREECSQRRMKVVEFPLKISLEVDETVRHLDAVRNIIENLLTFRIIFKNQSHCRKWRCISPATNVFGSRNRPCVGGCENRTTRNHSSEGLGPAMRVFSPFQSHQSTLEGTTLWGSNFKRDLVSPLRP